MAEMVSGMEILTDSSLLQKYNVDDLPVYLNKESLFDYPEKRVTSHWNDGLEIVNVLDGCMNITVNGVEYEARQSDVIVIFPGYVHYFENIEGNNCSYYCGVFHEALLSSVDPIVKRYINPMFHSFHPGVIVFHKESEYYKPIKEVFSRIGVLLNEKKFAYELRLSACLHEFLALLCDSVEQSFFLYTAADKTSYDAIRNMITYVQENYGRVVSVEELCEAGHVSRNQCFNVFQKYTGCTPSNYVMKFRLHIAKGMLATTDMSIVDIADVCGFAHQSHFTNRFSSNYGITPLQYLKKLLKK